MKSDQNVMRGHGNVMDFANEVNVGTLECLQIPGRIDIKNFFIDLAHKIKIYPNTLELGSLAFSKTKSIDSVIQVSCSWSHKIGIVRQHLDIGTLSVHKVHLSLN